MIVRLLCACCLLVAASAAQGSAARGRPDPAAGAPKAEQSKTPKDKAAEKAGSEKPASDKANAGEERVFRAACSEATSRDLFTACDADGDDRLDVFEASNALETVHGPRDHDAFTRIDKDRDGYLSWPEFDANLRTALHVAGTFRVRTCRPLAPTAPEPKPATPLQRFLQLHDLNQNGALDAEEIDRYLAQTQPPPAVVQQIRMLDVDRSGRLEEAELAPWAELMGLAPAPDAAGSSMLLPPWSSVDADHDNAIDADELARMLRRLDPALDRWAAELLRALDRNGDHMLQVDELPGPGTPRSSTAGLGPGAGSAGQLPKQSPVR